MAIDSKHLFGFLGEMGHFGTGIRMSFPVFERTAFWFEKGPKRAVACSVLDARFFFLTIDI